MNQPKRRILIVDDEAQVTELLADFCSGIGCEIKTVNDSREALALARAWKPDIITLDLEMPAPDGALLLQLLHADPITHRIPVVVISVLAREVELPQGEIQGVFPKPIDFRALLTRLQAILDFQRAA